VRLLEGVVGKPVRIQIFSSEKAAFGGVMEVRNEVGSFRAMNSRQFMKRMFNIFPIDSLMVIWVEVYMDYLL
jgi:hypothetical protein